MKKAILYARVAIPDQTGKPNQLKSQLDELQRYCHENGIEIIKCYSEVANGNNFNRVELQKLLTDLKTGDVKTDLLLFTTWDRFSRNFFKTIDMVGELENLNIKLQAIKDKIGSDAIYRLLKRLK